ncbi:hypothetical protein SDC9_180408 [bioreactor metagenome]|uniref:Uncharacterized protein n=1 Tax=bioreactor metagenome TaxID=1076179 RepID=A0A645H1M1_9ZZZZ
MFLVGGVGAEGIAQTVLKCYSHFVQWFVLVERTDFIGI